MQFVVNFLDWFDSNQGIFECICAMQAVILEGDFPGEIVTAQHGFLLVCTQILGFDLSLRLISKSF